MFLAGYFGYFSKCALSVHFAPDDMMNLAGYWRMKPLQLLLAQVMPWRPFYRPMGGVFYLSLYHLFGLNPRPYHAVLLAILFGNAWLVYRLAELAGACRVAAGLAAMVVCYHAGVSNLYYNTAFAYDALCCCFYLAAFICYLRLRRAERLLTLRATAGLLALYLCALNSKEMAATFPAMLVVYEWLYHRPAWLRASARVALPAGVLTAVFCYGHLVRAGGLIDSPAYRPVLNWAQVIDFQIRSWDDLLIRPARLEAAEVAAIWAVLTYLAWRRKRPVLRLGWWFLAIGPLPIEVLPGRAGACLAIPFAGLAIFASVVFVDASRAVAGFFSSEPGFQRLGQRRLFAAAVAAGALRWAWFNGDLQRRYIEPSMAELGQPTWDAIRQLDALHPRVKRNAEVVFVNDPFAGYDMEFIAELWFRDRSLVVRLPREVPVSAEEMARADRVFEFRAGKLVQVR